MKSNEDFIAGIYAKAEVYETEHAKREDNNVIHISSFQRKIKKISTYAAGVAACFACGMSVYLGTNMNKEASDNGSFLEGRNAQSDDATMPMTIESDPVTNDAISEQDMYGQYLHCTIVQITEQDGISHIDATIDGGDHVTLLVPTENRSKLIEVGNEIILTVSEADAYGNYSVVINQGVYLYSGIENGEKVFTNENQATLRESELNVAK